MALADRSFWPVLQTESTLQSRNSCMYHSRFMWSFLLPCCCATFGLVRKINDKNDQESTICNVCDGEIHRRVWGWVDSLLPDCRLINYGAENNSWIKPNWWMAMSGGRGSWGYALLRWYSNYISWPWRRLGDVDIQQLIYIHFSNTLFFQRRFAEHEHSFSVNTPSRTVYTVTHDHTCQFDSSLYGVYDQRGGKLPHGLSRWLTGCFGHPPRHLTQLPTR